jgi:hypothetical protein
MTETLPEATSLTAAPVVVRTVPCVYCREPIAADAFTYWSTARRLLSAACPTCQRQVTIAVATWQRWSRELGASEARP